MREVKVVEKDKKNHFTGFVLKLLGNEKWQFLTIPIFLIALSFVVASVIILILGKNPLMAFFNLMQGAGIMPKPSYAGYKSILTDFLTLLNFMTPMIFASLAVAVALKGGLFNIGVSGQMLLGGYLATVLVGYSGLNAFVAKPLVLIIGILGGAMLGGVVGFLKHKFNINEVVSSIMFNYIIQYVLSFFIHTKYIDPVSRQSKYINSAARLTLVNVERFGLKMDLPLGFIMAIVLSIGIKLFLDKSRVGFEIKAVGANPKGARYAGINVGKTMITTMALSGAFAGIAGATYYLGYFASIQPRVLPSMGFDAIAVALLGNNNPYGILASSFIISIIEKGSTYMSSIAGVRQEIASVITGLILLFSATNVYIQHKIRTTKEKYKYNMGKELEE
ncbi:MAG: ABC transporter permease [Tissierellaceae bacterium]|nr:ABC transporter permease [Tissierellaceae bacterium]